MGGSEFSHKKEGVGKVREGEGELGGGGVIEKERVSLTTTH